MRIVSFNGWRGVMTGVALFVALATQPASGLSQQPAPDATQIPAAPYRLPIITLVQPAGAAVMTQDRPIVVFRFIQGEPNDPIDLASFAVTVDGRDRTRSFHVTGTEAWGSLTGEAATQNDSSLTLGTHQIRARICSARGACGVIVSSLTVVPSQLESQSPHPAAEGAAADSAHRSASSRRRRAIDVILDAIRKLLSP